MNNKIVKLQLGDYFKWNNLSREDKVKRNKQIAKLYLDKGPSILNYYNALKAYFGGFNPENPYLITGEAPSPGWGKQGATGLHKMMTKLPEVKQILLAPLAGRSRAATIIKDKNIVEALKHRDEVYRRWASLYKQEYNPTPTTFRTKPAKIKRQETSVTNSNAKTLAGGKANAGGSYSSKSHTIRVTPSNNTSAKNLEDIAFHEGIHSYGLGESPSYVWKSKYLNFPEGTNPYFLDPREIATHGIQLGQNLGIKVGQAYPGKEAMIKIIENRPEGLGFGGVPIILYNNAKTNADYRRLWSLLNGTFKDGGVITAANARKWKYKEGGIIKAADGTKTNLFLKVGNFLNSDLGKTVGTGLVNAFSSWTSSNKLNNAIDSLIEGLKKQNKADINSIQNWALQKATEEITLKFNELLLLFNSGASFEQPSPIVFEHLKSQLASKYAQNAINDANLNSQEAIANLESLKTNPTSDVFSSLVNTGFDYLSNKFANKALDKNGVPSSRNASFYSNPYLKTQNKVGTINSNGSMNTGIGGTTYNWNTNTFGSNNIMNSFDKIKF